MDVEIFLENKVKLSKLQKLIIQEIANSTINYLECSDYHDNREGFISVSALFKKCYAYWEPNEAQRYIDLHEQSSKDVNKYRASFSRSLHTLFDNGLVDAMVLAWCFYDVHHGLEPIQVQGGGRHKIRQEGIYTAKDEAKRFRLVTLSDQGWTVTRDLFGPDLGKCKHIFLNGRSNF